MPSNSCGHLLSKLGINYQAPTVHRWLMPGLQRAVSREMTDELDGCGYNVVLRNEEEGGLGVHRNVPYEFVITV